MTANLYDAFAWATPDRPLILGPGSVMSYGQMADLSGQMANALASVGVVPGDRVAAQIEKSVPGLALYLAVLRMGAVFLPLNTGYTPKELEFFIGDARPSLIICDPRAVATVAPMAAGAAVLTLDAAGQGSLTYLAATMPAGFATVACGPDDLAAILYTSGTTGRPKGAMLTHRNLASNAAALHAAWRFTGDDVLLHALPVFHVHGLFVACNLVLLSGAAMQFLPKFDADAAIAALPGCTVMMGVPTFYTRLLTHPGLGAAARHMRLFISGSAPLLPDTHRQWQAATGHAILERYGMTETAMLTTNPYDGARVPGSVGPALDGVDLRVMDPVTGAALAQGETGMIEVRGPNIFKGYWQLPEKTAAEFRPDGYFITGDLGYIDPDGYVHIVGRGKDLVISGGLNVYPREVEAEIDEIPGVVESAVIGAPHPDFGEAVVAVVVQARGAALTEAGVVAALDGRLARFKLPKRVILVDDLPRNTMGKVQKNILRDRYGDLFSGPAADGS